MLEVHAAVNTVNDVVVALCETEVKAIAFAKAGSNRKVKTFPIITHTDGKDYISIKACNIILSTPEDRAEQALLDNQRSALAKAKAAGMTSAEIRALIAINQDEIK